jgi:hypothetical protein
MIHCIHLISQYSLCEQSHTVEPRDVPFGTPRLWHNQRNALSWKLNQQTVSKQSKQRSPVSCYTLWITIALCIDAKSTNSPPNDDHLPKCNHPTVTLPVKATLPCIREKLPPPTKLRQRHRSLFKPPDFIVKMSKVFFEVTSNGMFIVAL